MANREFGGTARTIAPLYFFLGAFSLVFQTILLREFFTVAAGNEISFAVALGGWLLGVGAGSGCAGLFHSRLRRSANVLPWVTASMCLSAPLLLAAVRCLQQLSATAQGTLIPLAETFWLVPLLTIPFSFFSGFAFPLAAGLEPALEPYNKFSAPLAKKICYLRLLSPLCRGLRRSAGSSLSGAQKMVRAYAWECAGALVAGIIYTYWLLEKMSPALIISCFTLPLLIGSAFVAAGATKKKALAVHVLLLVFNLYAVLAGGAGRFDSWLVRQRWQGLSSATWVESRDSRFQNLQLGVNSGQYCLYGNGQLATVFPDDDTQRILAAQIVTQHPRPRRVLVIGEGASGLAGHLLRYKLDRLIAVEIDGEFLDLIMDHLPAAALQDLRDPRLRLWVMDGRRFVMEAARAENGPENRFDIVYLHQPDAWTAALNRYYTREFFLDLRLILNPGGVVAMRLAAAENYASEITNPYTATIYQTLKSVFPAVAVSPGPVNFFSASLAPASVSSSPLLLAERYRRLVQPPADLAGIFPSLYPEEKTAFSQKALASYPVGTLNRDRQPIAYFLYGRLLGWTSGSPLDQGFDFFAKARFEVILAAMILLLSPAVLLAWKRRRKAPGGFSILLAAAGGGFAGLAMEILAIFAFQNIWGYVYQTVGLLIASFMLGMGVGAVRSGRWLKKEQPSQARARKVLAIDQLLIVAALLTSQPAMDLFAKMSGAAGQIPLFFWLGGMGFLIGAILPLGLHIGDRQAPAREAGWLNAADYLGGAIGAMATASFLLPLFGSAASLLLLAVPASAAALLLLIQSWFSAPAAE